MRKFRFLIFLLANIGLSSPLFSWSHSPTPPTGCIQIDPASCSGGGSQNAILHLEIRKGVTSYYHGNKGMLILTPVIGIITSAGYGEIANGENYVDGYEINFGFWSKDSYRRYTYSEMFRLKYHRLPTAAELASLTCEQVKSWFKERHHPWRDVNCSVLTYKKYCMNLTEEYYKFSGYVEFPGGVKCKVEDCITGKADYSHRQNSTFLVKIVKPCAACQ